MLDIHALIANLKRPRLLVRAARFGVDDYNRERALPRLLHVDAPPRSADALMQLMGVEAELNDQRLNKSATYSTAAHIETLTAIMGEAQILRSTQRPRIVAST